MNFQTLLDNDVYRTITLRTVGIALAVTLTDIVLAFPLAYYAARLATPRMRNALLIAVVLPLWANYLVRVFAWRLILTPNGFLNWLVESIGLGSLQVGKSNWAIWITPFTSGSRSRFCRSTRRSSACRIPSWKRRATSAAGGGSRSAASCSR